MEAQLLLNNFLSHKYDIQIVDYTMIEVNTYCDVVEIKCDINTLSIDTEYEIGFESVLIDKIIKMKEAIMSDKEYSLNLYKCGNIQRMTGGNFVCNFKGKHVVSIGDWLNNYTLWNLIHEEIITNGTLGKYHIDGDIVTCVEVISLRK